ncbi:MAG: ABC transporter ATP-binding protein [Deltaproteobacteria bacterium]|nr:ABC transporter ATP-binding protein [Deltaproteobacteria bacterium]
MSLLEIDNLTVTFAGGAFRAVDGLSLTVEEGEVLGIVGESGCGKSVAMLATLGLIGYPGRVSASTLRLAGQDLLEISPRQRRRILGKEVAMVFQEPMSSLNPCFTVGYQIMETLRTHEGGTRKELRNRTVELLQQVGIPSPEKRLRAFPHQLSGGMNQRVMIAMAIACNPRLLIADEPTTALDVTIQKQILELLLNLQRERGMAMVLITHNMGVVAESAHRVAVMYAGQVVELQPSGSLFNAPRHPYTAALLNSLPERGAPVAALGARPRLPSISGLVPGQFDRPGGCLFHPRCVLAHTRCTLENPALETVDAKGVRCHTPLTGPLAGVWAEATSGQPAAVIPEGQ